MSATIKEVASKAGVSIATVSRVFNNSGPVHDETRRRVREAAKQLRYTPSAIGRSLSTKRTDAIGLLLPDIYGEFFSEVIRGADQVAQQNRYHVLVSSSHNNKQAIEAAIQTMRGRVDGLIIMSPHIDAQTLHANLPKSLPAVLLNCHVEGDSFDSLNVDNLLGSYDMVRHLLEHGHRRVAVIKGPDQNYDAEERLRGYRRAVRENDADQSEQLEITGDFSEESGYDAAKRILGIVPRPTAVFASNDSMAIGALSALQEVGVRIPHEIALCGFDDIPISKYIKPALTTVHVPIDELGALAVKRVIQAVQEKNDHEKQESKVPTTLAIRESCGCNG